MWILPKKTVFDFGSEMPKCAGFTHDVQILFSGWGRLGYVFGHPEVIGQLLKVKDSYNVIGSPRD